MNITFDWDEVNSLITILNTKGINYIHRRWFTLERG